MATWKPLCTAVLQFLDSGGIPIHLVLFTIKNRTFFPFKADSFNTLQPHHGHWYPNILAKRSLPLGQLAKEASIVIRNEEEENIPWSFNPQCDQTPSWESVHWKPCKHTTFIAIQLSALTSSNSTKNQFNSTFSHSAAFHNSNTLTQFSAQIADTAQGNKHSNKRPHTTSIVTEAFSIIHVHVGGYRDYFMENASVWFLFTSSVFWYVSTSE